MHWCFQAKRYVRSSLAFFQHELVKKLLEKKDGKIEHLTSELEKLTQRMESVNDVHVRIDRNEYCPRFFIIIFYSFCSMHTVTRRRCWNS